MTTHLLAKMLLEAPDAEVRVNGESDCDGDKTLATPIPTLDEFGTVVLEPSYKLSHPTNTDYLKTQFKP